MNLNQTYILQLFKIVIRLGASDEAYKKYVKHEATTSETKIK